MKCSDWFSKSFKVSHCSVINVLCFALLRQLDYFIKSLFVCQALFYFFELCFKFSVLRQLVYSIKMFFICQEFFIFFCTSVLRQKKAQGVGFEPTRPCGQTVFKTASLWPLRYLSITYSVVVVLCVSRDDLFIIPNQNTYVNTFFKVFLFFLFFLSKSLFIGLHL